MIWVYILTPILTVLLGVMFGAPLLFPAKKLMPEVQAELDREEREDGELAIVKRQFVNDEISMLELEEQVVQILNGTWTNRPSPYGTVAEITTRGAVTHMPPPKRPPPKPSDAGRAVRSYSYPAAPGWPDVDPPHPGYACGRCHQSVDRLVPMKGICYECDKAFNSIKMSSDGRTLCTKEQNGVGVCGCPDCFGTEEFYEVLEATA